MFYRLCILSAIAVFPFYVLAAQGLPPYTFIAIASGLGTTGLLMAYLWGSFLLPKPFRIALVVMTWLALSAVMLGQFLYYAYFESFFSLEQLSWLKFIGDGAQSVNELPSPRYFVGLIVGCTSVFCFSLISSPFSRKKGLALFVIAAFTVGLLLQTAISKKLYIHQKLLVKVQTPYYLHPFHALFFFGDVDGELSKDEIHVRGLYKQRNGVLSRQEPPVSKKRYNILLITLESVSAQMLGAYGANLNISPNLDAFAKKSMRFDQFYAVSNYSVKGEGAVLCGILDGFSYSPDTLRFNASNADTCLPNILQNYGYQTHYYHGHVSRFYRRDQYLPRLGFQNLYFFGDEPESIREAAPEVGWGVSDRYMYKHVLDDLEQQSTPFFANFLTLSSHSDFDWKWDIEVPFTDDQQGRALTLFERFQNAIYYEDFAFGEFWDQFLKSSLADDTILVVTADHGIRSYPDSDIDFAEQNERFFRLPLFIYHPELKTERVYTGLGSQLDVGPTLLDLMGIDPPLEAAGKSLFNQVEEPWAVMLKSGGLRIRTKNKLCYLSAENKTKRGVTGSFFSTLERELDSSVRCDFLEGDLLKGGRVISSRVEDYEASDLSSAAALVRYYHRRFFATD